jgi:hypothetical protein
MSKIKNDNTLLPQSPIAFGFQVATCACSTCHFIRTIQVSQTAFLFKASFLIIEKCFVCQTWTSVVQKGGSTAQSRIGISQSSPDEIDE